MAKLIRVAESIRRGWTPRSLNSASCRRRNRFSAWTDRVGRNRRMENRAASARRWTAIMMGATIRSSCHSPPSKPYQAPRPSRREYLRSTRGRLYLRQVHRRIRHRARLANAGIGPAGSGTHLPKQLGRARRRARIDRGNLCHVAASEAQPGRKSRHRPCHQSPGDQGIPRRYRAPLPPGVKVCAPLELEGPRISRETVAQKLKAAFSATVHAAFIPGTE